MRSSKTIAGALLGTLLTVALAGCAVDADELEHSPAPTTTTDVEATQSPEPTDEVSPEPTTEPVETTEPDPEPVEAGQVLTERPTD